MRGGLERWKRGSDSRGVNQAVGYALEGSCDAHRPHLAGADALASYAEASDATVSRFIVASGRIGRDELTAGGLRPSPPAASPHDPHRMSEEPHMYPFGAL